MRNIFIIFISTFLITCSNSEANHHNLNSFYVEEEELIAKSKIDSALSFAQKNKLNTDYSIFVDMSIHSGKYRFFVYDFKKSSIIQKSLCAHGYGKGSTEENPVFSNENGSYCSSLGRYKIGVRSYSKWGINVHYKLHGYDKTNDNAYQRIVVLHSFNPVKSEEIYPQHLPLGWSQGCPVVDNETMKYLDQLFKTQKEVLFWVYN